MATLVGESTLVKGNLEGDEDLTVQGRVEGAISLERTLMVEPSGVVKAEVSVRNAIINGVVVGNVSATDSIELTEEARVVGDLTAPRVIIVDGASFRGKVDMGDLDLKRPAAPRPTQVVRPQVERTEAAPAPAPKAAPKPAAPKKTSSSKSAKAPPKPPRASKQKKKVKVKKKKR